MANILITGGSGYLGGDFLHHLRNSSTLALSGTVYALVRTDEQAEKVKELYDATPLTLDLSDQAEITKALVDKQISIVFFLIDASKSNAQLKLLHGLSEVSKQTGLITHFLHTSGAKIFSGFAGFPIYGELSDADKNILSMQKTLKPQLPDLQKAINTDTTIVEQGEALGVKTYVFIPCIVYGESAGFGNKTSIQTKAVITAARGARQLCRPDDLDGIWPVCHVRDNSKLYTQLLEGMLSERDIPHGSNGYYLAAAGSIPWIKIYTGIARALADRGIIDTAEIGQPNDAWLSQAAKALDSPKESVALQMGGKCILTAENGPKIDWRPEYTAEHILAALESEVDLVVKH